MRASRSWSFFISTHGTRKGLADTALRTADSGYLTRRLVDVSQDIIVREDDCGTERGLAFPVTVATAEGGRRAGEHLDTSLTGRILSRPVLAPDGGEELAPAGQMVYVRDVERFVAAGVADIRVRSVLTCDSKVGCCARCYGTSLATGKLVDIGEAVGIIAAQSIGEPGTQLTMRTFHSGGVAGEDITHGLPRVVELFEARQPKGLAPIAESPGRVQIEETERLRKITVIPDDGSEEISYQVSKRIRLLVQDGGRVDVGDPVGQRRCAPARGPADPGSACGAEAPRRRGPGGLPVAGCRDPRQAHRDRDPADAAPRDRDRVRELRAAAR